jgi:hypothetical protein
MSVTPEEQPEDEKENRIMGLLLLDKDMYRKL